jgi:hypothetical protein
MPACCAGSIRGHVPIRFRRAAAGRLAAAPAGVQSNFQTPHPVLFVTVFPIQNDFATIGSVFGTHDRASRRRNRPLWPASPYSGSGKATARAIASSVTV